MVTTYSFAALVYVYVAPGTLYYTCTRWTFYFIYPLLSIMGLYMMVIDVYPFALSNWKSRNMRYEVDASTQRNYWFLFHIPLLLSTIAYSIFVYASFSSQHIENFNLNLMVNSFCNYIFIPLIINIVY